MKEKRKFHNSHYDLYHLKHLYELALNHWAMYLQWSNDIIVPCSALEYWNKCQAIVELMESITVFYVGLGYCVGKSNYEIRKSDTSLKGRLNSFKWIESVDFSTC